MGSGEIATPCENHSIFFLLLNLQVTVLAAAGAFAMPVVGISVGIVAGVKTL